MPSGVGEEEDDKFKATTTAVLEYLSCARNNSTPGSAEVERYVSYGREDKHVNMAGSCSESHT